MKKILFIVPFISLNVFADPKYSELSKAMSVLSNPSDKLNALCNDNSPVPSWCLGKISGSVCAIKKTSEKTIENYYDDLDKRFLKSLPANTSAMNIARSRYQAVVAAETETATRTKVSSNDLKKLLDEVKSSLLSIIKKSPLDKKTISSMEKTVGSVKLQTASEYILDEANRLISGDSSVSKDDAMKNAVTSYNEFCGDVGMSQNAFYEPSGNAMIICPGLVQSVSEFGAKREDVLNGLSFTVAHELAHSIDGLPYFEDVSASVETVVYKKMGDCFEKVITGTNWSHQQAEVVADYWGSRVFGERLKSQKIENEKTIYSMALAMDGLCEDEGDKEHPSGKYRIDNILSRDIEVGKSLNCEEELKKLPQCDLEGKIKK